MNIGKTMPITQRSLNLTKIQQPVITPHTNKSFTFEHQNIKDQQLPFSMVEHPANNGCTGVYACGPLTRQRYINPKLEKELVEFKKEVEGKFSKSETSTFTFPRMKSPIPKDDLTQFLVDAEVNLRRRILIPKTDRKFVNPKLHYQTHDQRTTQNETSVNLSLNYDYHTYGETTSTSMNTQSTQLQSLIKGYPQKSLNARTNPTRFKDSSVKMPEIIAPKNKSAQRYQEAASSKSRMNTQRMQTNSNTTSNKQPNVINVNNPQVIIQSPQNNTIIFMNGKTRENSSRNMINDLIKRGLLSKDKFQSSRDPGVNKSFEGAMVNSFRQPQQQVKAFDHYLKQNIVMADDSCRNKINLLHKVKYDTTRSAVTKRDASVVSKSFVLPSPGKKYL